MTLNDSQMTAYREARREGLTPSVALYVARPPVVELDWNSHYQVDGEWAYFERDGHRYKVTADDPARVEGDCVSCRELVDAYRRKDDDMAWMTPEEYEQTEHRFLSVVMVDDDDEEIAQSSSLWGVCGTRNTPTERRMDDRYVAETAVELSRDALADWTNQEIRKRDAVAARINKRNTLVNDLLTEALVYKGGLQERAELESRIRDLLNNYVGEA